MWHFFFILISTKRYLQRDKGLQMENCRWWRISRTKILWCGVQMVVFVQMALTLFLSSHLVPSSFLYTEKVFIMPRVAHKVKSVETNWAESRLHYLEPWLVHLSWRERWALTIPDKIILHVDNVFKLWPDALSCHSQNSESPNLGG